MKKVMLGVFIAIAFLAVVNSSKAQATIDINIAAQPEWGPTGYDRVEYYYMPDIESYYYVPKKQFVYFSGNRWVFAPALPPAHANYNLYSGYKVVVNRPNAYKYFNDHKVKYVKYKNYNNRQVLIKNKHDNGNHNGQYKSKGNSNGNSGKGNGGKGNGKGHGKGKN